MTLEQIDLYKKAFVDKSRIFFIEHFLKTYDATTEGEHEFILFPRQKAFLQSLASYRNTIAIKPRQAGITTTTAAWATAQIAFSSKEHPETVLCIANKLDLSQLFLVRVKTFLDGIPRWIWGDKYYDPDPTNPKNKKSIYVKQNKSQIELFNGSMVYARSSGKDASQKVSAASILVFDEAAFIEDFYKEEPNIAFLDIYLQGEARGVEIAHKLRAEGSSCIIIFVTTSTEFALEGYEVEALHYLVKPVNKEKVEACFDRCHRVLHDLTKSISITGNMGRVAVALNSIYYIEFIDRVTHVVVKDSPEPIRTYESLSELGERLQDQRFLQTYRSFIINMDYVGAVSEGAFVMIDDKEIPIRQRDRSAIKKEYYSYLFHKVRNI